MEKSIDGGTLKTQAFVMAGMESDPKKRRMLDQINYRIAVINHNYGQGIITLQQYQDRLTICEQLLSKVA